MRSWRPSRGGLVWFLLHLAAGAVSAAEDVGGKLWCSGNGYPPSPRGGVISLQYRMLHGRTKLMRLRMRTQFWRATAFVAVGLLGAGSWSEKTATGASAPALGTLGTGNIGVSAGAAESFVSIDVTAAVQTWRDGLLANNGLALVAHSGSSFAISVDSEVVSFNGSSCRYITNSGVVAQPDLDPRTWPLIAQKGDAGAMGPAGLAGQPGPQGLPGYAGPVGPQGPQGLKGDTGATGATGPQRPAGSNGPSGPAGPTGAAGPQGPQGDAGAAGTPGAPGLNWRGFWDPIIAWNANDAVTFYGSSYIHTDFPDPYAWPGHPAIWQPLAGVGLLGPAGAAGLPGPAGPAGPQGPAGAGGTQGSQGLPGPEGSA